MARKFLLLGTMVGTLGFLTPAYAEIWDFGTPTGVIASPHNYVGTAGTIITATAFGPNSPSLFGKNDGGDEVGVGETNDPSMENEISPGSFIQLSLSNINFATNSVNLSFQAASTTDGETWQVWGSNTSGVLGTLLGSCTSSGGSGNSCEGVMTINGLGNFTFADVTASVGNVLLSEIDTLSAVPVPGPTIGAGLPGLVAACGGLIALARRRRRQLA